MKAAPEKLQSHCGLTATSDSLKMDIQTALLSNKPITPKQTPSVANTLFSSIPCLQPAPFPSFPHQEQRRGSPPPKLSNSKRVSVQSVYRVGCSASTSQSAGKFVSEELTRMQVKRFLLYPYFQCEQFTEQCLESAF